MTVEKKKIIDSLDRGFANVTVYSTGTLTENSVRVQRQASFTTALNRALTAVGIALLLLSAVIFWNAMRSTGHRERIRDRRPAIDRSLNPILPIAFGPGSLITKASFRLEAESKAVKGIAVV